MKTGILNNERGQGLTEYLILLVLIGVAAIAATQQVGTAIRGRLDAARTKINSVSVNP